MKQIMSILLLVIVSLSLSASENEFKHIQPYAVEEALINNYGIEKIRLTTIGEGEESPTTTNTTINGRAANRRI